MENIKIENSENEKNKVRNSFKISHTINFIQ